MDKFEHSALLLIHPFPALLSAPLALFLAAMAIHARHWNDMASLKHLTLLSITGSGLSGSLPAALFTMPNLKHLDLSNNKLSGRIPDEVGLATCLQTMDLSSNYLHGSLPASLGNLSHLTR
ncbi:unnamed protein product, partial [Closterium sp. NIES-65]